MVSLSLHGQLLQYLNDLVHALRDLSRLELPRIALSVIITQSDNEAQRQPTN